MDSDVSDGPGGQHDIPFKAHSYPVVLSCSVPDWTMQIIDFQLHGDPRIVNYCSTYADHYRRPPSQVMAISKNQQEEKLSDSTPKSSLIRYNPQDAPRNQQRRDSLPPSSAYNETYRFRWCAPPKPVKQSPAVMLGDPEGTHERETSYEAHFCHKGTIRPVIQQHQEHQITFGEYAKKWTTTTSDFHSAVETEPVLRVKKDRNFSCVLRGELDPEQDRERMAITSYKFFFSKKDPKEPLVHIDGPSTRTKSDVVLGQLSNEDLPYATTASLDYPKRTVVRVQPVTQPPGHVLNSQEDGPKLTTMQIEYRPVNGKRHMLSLERLEEIKGSHITPPSNEVYFTTAYKEVYGPPKPLCWTARARVPRQQVSHMPF